MRHAWWVMIVAGCGHKDVAPPAQGSALVAAAPIAAVPAVATCDATGSYRFRFTSNGADGWWLPIAVKDGKAIVPDHVGMLGLDERTPIATNIDGCTVKLAAHSDTAGDVSLAFTLDPKTNVASGELRRTAGADDVGSPAKQAVTGRRDVGGAALPRCLKPGVFHIAATGAWKLSAGKPRFGNTCKDMAEPVTETFVRVQPFGDELVVDAVENSPDHRQSFERGKVKRLSDCEIHLELAQEDFDFSGTLTFDGDKLSGSASDAHYVFMEDGDAGENQWECRAKNARLTGERIAD